MMRIPYLFFLGFTLWFVLLKLLFGVLDLSWWWILGAILLDLTRGLFLVIDLALILHNNTIKTLEDVKEKLEQNRLLK